MMMYKFCPQTKVQLLQKSVCRAVLRGWCLHTMRRMKDIDEIHSA